MSWIVKTILGIKQITPGFGSVRVEPYFFKDMDYAKGICRTCGGDISVSWERNSENVQVEITVPEGMKALYKETTLSVGKNVFIETL